MSIYVEDNKYAQEVRGELEMIANPHYCTGHLFSPSAPTAGGNTVSPESSGKYYLVTFPTPIYQNDLGACLISKLATNRFRHVFIHGVSQDFYWTYYDNRGNTETRWVSREGGGFTTDLKSAPNVDVYIDASKNNDKYTIDPVSGGAPIQEKPYVRLFHELLHAEGIIFGLANSHRVVIPKTNDFMRQRKLGYERAMSWSDYF